jgi:hypothetical protein
MLHLNVQGEWLYLERIHMASQRFMTYGYLDCTALCLIHFTDCSQPVAVTFQLSFNLAQQEHERRGAIEVLYLISVLDKREIPETLLLGTDQKKKASMTSRNPETSKLCSCPDLE